MSDERHEAFKRAYEDYPSQDNEGFTPDRGSFKAGFLAAWKQQAERISQLETHKVAYGNHSQVLWEENARLREALENASKALWNVGSASAGRAAQRAHDALQVSRQETNVEGERGITPSLNDRTGSDASASTTQQLTPFSTLSDQHKEEAYMLLLRENRQLREQSQQDIHKPMQDCFQDSDGTCGNRKCEWYRVPQSGQDTRRHLVPCSVHSVYLPGCHQCLNMDQPPVPESAKELGEALSKELGPEVETTVQVSDAPLGARLHSTMDAEVWTKEFMQLWGESLKAPLDHELMRAWFANAIMCGFDIAHQRIAAKAAQDSEEK